MAALFLYFLAGLCLSFATTATQAHTHAHAHAPLGSQAAAAAVFNRTLWLQGLTQLLETGVEVPPSEAEPMDVQGALPSWLNGRYYRNGPGRFEVQSNSSSGSGGGQIVKGVFDGYASVHMFAFDGASSTVSHSMRFMSSPRYKQLLKRGDMSYQGKLMLGTGK